MRRVAASLALAGAIFAVSGSPAFANTVTPSSFSYGSLSVGGSLDAQFTFTASTNGLSNPSLESGTPGFQIITTGVVSRCQGQPLTAGQSCNFLVRFRPLTAGSFQETVRVTSSTGPKVAISGTGVAAPSPGTGKKGKKCKKGKKKKGGKKAASAAKKKCGKKKKKKKK